MADNIEKHSPDELEQMERYAITFDGEKYRFDEYNYNTLADAINYSKLQKKKNPNRTINSVNQNEVPPSDSPTEIEENNRINDILFVTSESFTSSNIIKTLGMARGSTVRAKHIGRDFMADLKNIVGGELKGYTELLAEGREEAIYRMKQDAVRLGANALVSVRLTTSTITTGATEMLAYGTAVIIEEE